MLRNAIRRVHSEGDGVELVEWAIVAVFFAVAGSLFWGDVAGAVAGVLQNVVGIF